MDMSSQTPPEELQKAFSQFSATSADLVAAYEQLQGRVMALTGELARAREAQARELDEKERLAQRLALLVESLPGGVVVVDRDGRVAECNPAAERLFGAGLTGEPWVDVVRRSFQPQPDDGHDISLANGRRVSISTCSLGREPGQILLFSDVTETRRLQGRISHLHRLSDMGRMAASLAHQVRTPIATALLHVGNLGRGDLPQARREQLAGKLRDVLRHMERLVKDMLDFAHTGEIEVAELDAAVLCSALEAAGGAICAQRGGRFTSRCDVAGRYVQGNPDALATVVQNLVNNAIEAGGPEVAVDLRVAERDGEVLIEVADDGPGMDEKQAARVFEPFVSTRAGGTGLGLAVAQAVVQSHGGRIELATAPGAGTRFAIFLPVARTEPQPPAGAGNRGAP